jgi:hypothetical protein
MLDQSVIFKPAAITQPAVLRTKKKSLPPVPKFEDSQNRSNEVKIQPDSDKMTAETVYFILLLTKHYSLYQRK